MITDEENFFVELFHGTNRFLGSPEGTLVKLGFEFALLLLATYMIISEWVRTKNKQLKSLAIGFGMYALSKLIGLASLVFVVFGEMPKNSLQYAFFIQHVIELLAIGVICICLSMPLLERRFARLSKQVKKMWWLTAIPIIIDLSFWPDDYGALYGFAALMIAELLILAVTIAFMSFYYKEFKTIDKYHRSVYHAMIVLMISPLLYTINFLFFNHTNPALIIMGHPFPFISVLMITRVVYQRVSDKAAILEELMVTEQKYQKTKEICELKDDFVSMVSHELRTPITAIKLYTSLLKKGNFGAVDKKHKEAFAVIEDECDRLSKLINDVLDVSKLEKNKVNLDIQKIDLHSVAEKSKLEPLALKKGVAVINDIPKGTIVAGDFEKIQQVFVNLVSNAIKFTPDDNDGRIVFSSQKKKGFVTVRISDNGIGIPKESIPKLFDRFYQVQNHLTRSQGGTGLGLAIVKQIVELHGGCIDVESEIGKGTTVTISLPIDKRK